MMIPYFAAPYNGDVSAKPGFSFADENAAENAPRRVFSYSLFFPKDDLSGFQGTLHIDEPLVFRAAKAQPDVLFGQDEGPVHQRVNAPQQLRCLRQADAIRSRGQLFPGIARVGPDVLLRISLFHPAQKGQQDALVLRLKGISAEQRQSADVVGLQQPQQLLLGLRRKGLAVIKRPGLRLKTPGAVIAAAGHEQADPHPQTVCDIAVFDRSVIHGLTDAARAL